MRRLLYCFVAISIFFACKSDKALHSESKVLYDQVMAVHDEVMPKMRDVRQLSKKLKKIEESQSEKEIQDVLSNMELADEAMMDWMAQFKMPKNKSREAELEYLNGQIVSVNDMKDKMLSAISQAEKLLGKIAVE